MNDTLTTDKLLNTDQLARLLGLSKTSIYRLISGRKIPFYKVGHNIRVKKADILNYLDKNCTQAIA